VTAVKQCTAKADAAAWAALGCVVDGTQNSVTVAGLGTVAAASGYNSCAITCPTAGSAFTVNAVENTCIAKADAAAWTAVGCVVAGTQDGTTVTALGSQSAASGYQSCAITCPINGGNFAVSATPVVTTTSTSAATTAATTAEPASTATTAAPAAKAAVDAGVQVTPNKMGILIAFLALFFIH